MPFLPLPLSCRGCCSFSFSSSSSTSSPKFSRGAHSKNGNPLTPRRLSGFVHALLSSLISSPHNTALPFPISPTKMNSMYTDTKTSHRGSEHGEGGGLILYRVHPPSLCPVHGREVVHWPRTTHRIGSRYLWFFARERAKLPLQPRQPRGPHQAEAFSSLIVPLFQ